MSTNLEFGLWLRDRRKTLDLTQPALAKVVNCSVVMIKKIEAGERRPSDGVAELLAKELEVAAADRPAFVQWARGTNPAPPQSVVAAAVKPLPRASDLARLHIHRTTFFGREKEIEAVRTLLEEGVGRLVTLTGLPGTGKTRLALKVAVAEWNNFPSGVYFVPLAALHDPALVLPAIAEVVGVRETPGRSLLANLGDAFSDKQVLLVLDNFEQVLLAADLLAELLIAAPRLKMLATSRTRLQISGELEYPVPPLPLPSLSRSPLPTSLATSPALALFAARARALQPNFELTAENAPTVAAICERLDGLPLAIELAAARIKVLTLSALLTRLEHERLPVLTGGARDLPPRQQTLRGAIASSYDLLTAPQQALFRRLGVFVGGCTFDAAEQVAVAAGDLAIAMLDGLTTLIDQSLMRLETGADGTPRYTMLETIREYALEQLAASGEEATTRRAHAAYYLVLTETAEPELVKANQSVWFDRLEAEHNNLRPVLGWALDQGEYVTAARLAGAIWYFWQVRSHWTEGLGWLEAALADRQTLPAKVLAKALYGAGALTSEQGDGERARVLLEEALSLYREIADQRGIATLLNALGLVVQGQEEYVAAESFFAESMTHWQTLQDKPGLSLALGNLGLLAHDQGDLERAERLYKESLALTRELGDTGGVATLLNNLGEVALQQARYTEAQSRYSECLPLFQRVGSPRGIVESLECLAIIAAGQAQKQRAARLFGAAEQGRAAHGIPPDRSYDAEYQQALEATRLHLDEAVWAASWAAGQAMTLDEAVEFALAVT